MTERSENISPELTECHGCGAKLLYDDARYCPQCGNPTRKLSKDDALGLFGCVFGGLAVFCHFLRSGGK